MGIASIHDQIRTIEMHAKKREQLECLPEMVAEIESVISSCISQLQMEIE
jgi:hypothetical protein